MKSTRIQPMSIVAHQSNTPVSTVPDSLDTSDWQATSSSASTAVASAVSIAKDDKRKTNMFRIITNAVEVTKSNQSLMGEFVAAGSFGSVYRLRNDPTMALKTLKWRENTGFSADLVRELNVYSQIASPYVQCLSMAEIVLVQQDHSSQQSGNQGAPQRFIGLISPFANAQSLDTFMTTPKWKHLFGRPDTSLIMFQYVSRQILAGASAVNEGGIVHQDLKPANYLVFDSDPKNLDNMTSVIIKVADMGSATLSEGPLSLEFAQGVCTPLFAPPEFSRNGNYDERSDTWSVGVTFLCIFASQFVFAEDNNTTRFLGNLSDDTQIQARVKQIIRSAIKTNPGLQSWPPGILDGFSRMVSAMLTFDITKRYKTTDLLYKAFAGVKRPNARDVSACIDVRAMTRNLLREWGQPHDTDEHIVSLRNSCLTFVFRMALQLTFINIMAFVFIVNTLDRILVPIRNLGHHAIEVNTIACMTLVLKCLVDDQTTEKKVVETAWKNKMRFTLDELALAEAGIMRHINGNITLHQKWTSCSSVKEVGDLLLMSFKPFLLLSFFVTTAKKKPRSSSSIVSDRVWKKYFGVSPNPKQNGLCNKLRLQDALKMGRFKELGSAEAIVTSVAQDIEFQTLVHWEEHDDDLIPDADDIDDHVEALMSD